MNQHKLLTQEWLGKVSAEPVAENVLTDEELQMINGGSFLAILGVTALAAGIIAIVGTGVVKSVDNGVIDTDVPVIGGVAKGMSNFFKKLFPWC